MLKVGLIGCGFMGTMHAACYKNIEGVELVALSDIREECAKKRAEGTEATLYGDGMELINNADVDVIDICLPTYLHSRYAIAAMDKVKYVFVEKPVALTKDEGEAMLKKAAETGANLQVGQVIRFWDEYVELEKIIKSGVYGRVVNAGFKRISPIPTWGWESWLLKNELSGGAALDLHIHDVDYVLAQFGIPKRIKTVKNKLGETDSYINSFFEYEDFAVSVEGTWGLPETHPFEAEFRVVFERGVVENANGRFLFYDEREVKEIEIQRKEVGDGGFSGGNISGLVGYYDELLYFTDCAKSKSAVERATLSDGFASLSFVLDEIKNA